MTTTGIRAQEARRRLVRVPPTRIGQGRCESDPLVAAPAPGDWQNRGLAVSCVCRADPPGCGRPTV